VLANSTVARSPGARVVFLAGAGVTAFITVWAANLGISDTRGLEPIFTYLFSTQDHDGARGALVILLAAVFVRRRDAFGFLLRWVDSRIKPIALVTFAVLCVGTLLLYRNQRLTMDEYSVYFQSQVFAAGHLTGRFPVPLLNWLVPPEFQRSFLFVSHATGAVVTGYWPGFALLLTPFTLLGIPWACNPAISAATLLVIHRLATRILADREAAGLAVLLTLLAPVFFAEGTSYYSMPAHLLGNALYALLLLDPTPRRACLAGVVGSIALTLHNPVPHILFAVPWFIWLLTRPRGVPMTLALIAGYLPLSLLLGLGWFVFAMHLLQDGAATGMLSAELKSRTGEAFAFPNQAICTARVIGLAKVVVWAAPGTLLLACVGAWKWRHNSTCWLLTASALLTLIGYLFVAVDQGHGWGFRYFHSAWLALPLLAAGALIPAPGQPRPSIFHDPATRTFFVACTLLTLFGGVGLRAWQIGGYVSEHLRQLPVYSGHEPRVVIVDPANSFYGHDLVQNDPWLRGPEVRMITHGKQADTALMSANFPHWQPVTRNEFGSVWVRDPP
jgi:hypothetical protein